MSGTNGHEHEPTGGWTRDAQVTVLDNGLVLTPWGTFRVIAAQRTTAQIAGLGTMGAIVVEMRPLADGPTVTFAASR